MENKVYSKVYFWLFIGLLVTFLTGIYTATNKDALAVFTLTPTLFTHFSTTKSNELDKFF